MRPTRGNEQAMTDKSEDRALSGIRVLELARVTAAPHAAWQLCNLGAEVIKVERPVFGDDTRSLPWIYDDGLSQLFMQQNSGKKSLSIDLRNPASLPILEQLVAISDVV